MTVRLNDDERRVIAQYELELAHGRRLVDRRLRMGTWLLGWRRWMPFAATGYGAVALLVLLPPWSPVALTLLAVTALAAHGLWWAARRLRRHHRRPDRRWWS